MTHPVATIYQITFEEIDHDVRAQITDMGVVVNRRTAAVQPHLIVVDDIGMLPVGRDAAEGFYRLVDAAYEKRSVAIASNLHPAGFDELMPKTLETATVDRLLHHAHVVVTEGESFRLGQAEAGKGVTPLN